MRRTIYDMKIPIKKLATDGPVMKVVIDSVDLSLYIAFAVIDGQECLITDSKGGTIKTRNLLEMKKQLEGLSIAELTLRQRSAYDEMVGQPKWGCDNAMEVGISPELYPTPSWQH